MKTIKIQKRGHGVHKVRYYYCFSPHAEPPVPGRGDTAEEVISQHGREALARGYDRAELTVYDDAGKTARIDSWDLSTGEPIPWRQLAAIPLRGFGPARCRPDDPTAYGAPDQVVRLYGPSDWSVWWAVSGFTGVAIIAPPWFPLPHYIPDDGRLQPVRSACQPEGWRRITELSLAPQAGIESVWSPNGAEDRSLWRRESWSPWWDQDGDPAAGERAAVDSVAALRLGAD